MPCRERRKTATYRGASGTYYGFTVFTLEETLPRAAGIFALATPTIGPRPWRILLIGETPNFFAELSAHGSNAINEARRRGATHILLHFSPIATDRRREAGHDLWRHIRSPLVAWDNEDILRRA
ncbi:MAG: hypothetical protein GKS00_10160 [Alphaproteobacteria bacterium]|nr:hypothetical protein [Alphaproteobacteria bacterium]